MARVLLIDDDHDLVHLLGILVKSWGHEVSSAGNPAEGLEACRQWAPHVILLDYHMPGDTGAHLFEALRRNNATAEIPVIFMSAIASKDQVLREIAEPGLCRFLPKPVDTPKLKEALDEMLASG